MKLLVLSDLHLTLPGETLEGIDPLARLEAAVARINRCHADADLVVLAGDLTDRGRTAAYAALRDALAALIPPVAITLGNHDNRDVFARVFGGAHLDVNGFAQSLHLVGGQAVILLDTLQKGPTNGGWGTPEGALCPVRLDWLDRALAAAAGRPVQIVMHHPALQIPPRHDPYLLADPQPFLDRVAAAADLRVVIAGHVHLASAQLWQGRLFQTIAGGHATARPEFGGDPARRRLQGPAQMGVVLGDAAATTVLLDDYVDWTPELGDPVALR